MADNLPPMKTPIRLLFAVLIIILLLPPTWAGPTVEIKSTGLAAEKGHSFQIHVIVTAEQALTNVIVAPIVPEGFAVEALGGDGLRPIKNGELEETNAIRIADIPAAGSVTVAFRACPPDMFGRPMGHKKQSYYSTREAKIFGFNVTGTQISDGESQGIKVTKSVSLRYTTSLGYYLLAGMAGVLLGYLVKIATQYKEEISQATKDKAGVDKLKVFLSEVFVVRSAYVLTLGVMGFGVLLVLAKESLPVSSWHQAIALGMGIGVFSDEQLISKFKV